MSALEELMSAALTAPEERKAEALRVLRGEDLPKTTERKLEGPLLIPMGRAAELLGLSRVTLWRMCNAGTFQKIEIMPGSYRLRRADLEEFVAGRLQGAGGMEHRAEAKEETTDEHPPSPEAMAGQADKH